MSLLADNGMTFPQRKNAKGYLEFSKDITLLVKNSIHQILGTRLGERVMEPEFGSRIPELIFEPIDEIVIALARVYVIQAIERWEPRVQLNEVAITINPDQGIVEIYGSYVIVNRGLVEDFQVAFPRIITGG